MRTIKLLSFAAIFVLIGFSCSKETMEPHSVTKPDDSPSIAAFRKIQDFRDQVAAYKDNPALKSGERMSVDDALWNFNAVLNFERSRVDDPYEAFYFDSVTVNIPVGADDSINIPDVLAGYLALNEGVSGVLDAAPLNDKAVKFSYVFILEHDGQNVKLGNEVIIGEGGAKPKPPFVSGDDWMYGDDFGKCDGTNPGIDGGDIIADAVNQYRYLHINDQGQIVFYTNPVNFLIIKEDLIDMAYSQFFNLSGGIYDNYRDYRLFYAHEMYCPPGTVLEDFACIYHNDMNFYFEQFEELVYEIIPYKPQHWPEVYLKTFVSVSVIDGHNGWDQYGEYYVHEPNIRFADRHVIHE